ncbi:unnamed protein product [Heligmosomoides polygyrus]|uniref:Histone H4 n=1 Tax=Heligmosomoides polygyrus TaxID=6339 RepID=A0A183F4P2_HELPZ|nr:unnamed protein product [Heligmosomoides polygyrus]
MPTDHCGTGSGRRLQRARCGHTVGISTNFIKGIARRDGVGRVSGLVYDEAPRALKTFLEDMIEGAAYYCTQANKSTVTSMEVIYAL